jgi:hypothetical protein
MVKCGVLFEVRTEYLYIYIYILDQRVVLHCIVLYCNVLCCIVLFINKATAHMLGKT